MIPALITGLPRSRSAWFANLLTFGKSIVYHDGLYPSNNEMLRSASVKRVVAALQSGAWTGHSDAANVLIWKTLADEFPKAKWVVCKRDLNSVLNSCRKIIPDMPTAGIGAFAKELDELIAELKPLVVDFDDITPITAYKVADHLEINIGSTTRVRQLCDFNVQIHPPILLERLKALICQPVTGDNKQTK